MPRFASCLVDRREVAEGTMDFAFKRPTGFDFVAGQFLTVILSHSPHSDARGNRRVFTIASPPQEAGRLEIATRMTGSGLKRNLAEAAIGARWTRPNSFESGVWRCTCSTIRSSGDWAQVW